MKQGGKFFLSFLLVHITGLVIEEFRCANDFAE